MPRLTEETRERRRQRIAEAALTSFAEHGLVATTMADIIGHSGMSAGSIYSHFSSKADILHFVTTDLLDSRLRIFRGDTGTPPSLTPRAAFLRLTTVTALDRPLARILLELWVEVGRDDRLAVIARRNMFQIRDVVRESIHAWAQAQPDANTAELLDSVTDAVMAATQGYAARLALDPDPDAATLARRIARALPD